MSAAWLDYDRDGRLDLFVGNYVKWSPATEVTCAHNGVRGYCGPNAYKPTAPKLYRNTLDRGQQDRPLRGCHGRRRPRPPDRQGHGDRRPRLQHRRLARRVHRQRPRARQALSQRRPGALRRRGRARGRRPQRERRRSRQHGRGRCRLRPLRTPAPRRRQLPQRDDRPLPQPGRRDVRGRRAPVDRRAREPALGHLGGVLPRLRPRRVPRHLRRQRRHRRVAGDGLAGDLEPAAAAPAESRGWDVRQRHADARRGVQPAGDGPGSGARGLRWRRRSRHRDLDAQWPGPALPQRQDRAAPVAPRAHGRIAVEPIGHRHRRARDERVRHAGTDGPQRIELRVAERADPDVRPRPGSARVHHAVEWPSGQKQTFADLAPNQVVVVDEARGLVLSGQPGASPSPADRARPR